MTFTPELLQLNDGIDAVVDALADGAGRLLPSGDLRDLLVLTGRLVRRVEALAIIVADEVADRSGGAEADRFDVALGCRDVVSALELTTGTSAQTARAWLRASRLVCPRRSFSAGATSAILPQMREGLLRGDIGLAGVLAVERPLLAARERADVEQFSIAEESVAAAAIDDPTAGDYVVRREGVECRLVRPASADVLRVHAEAWAARIDQDGPEPDESVPIARRSFSVGRQRGGLVRVIGDVLPDVAGQLAQLLSAITNPKNSPEGVRFAPSWDVTAGPDRPSATQRRHDAFATILFAAARTPDLPMQGGAAPTIVVRVDARDLARGTGIAEVDGGLTVPLSVARQVSCGGALTRVDMRGGRVSAIMTEARVFNKYQRQAIAARDGVCVMTGCDVPAMWCEIHHVTPWASRQRTTVDDGVLLCWAHHRFLEVSGWEIRMNEGVPHVRSPAWMDPQRRWRPAGVDNSGRGG